MKNEHNCDYLESEAAKSWTRRIASWILRQLCMTYHSRWLFRVRSRSFFFGASETTKLSSIGLQYRLPRCYDITQYFGTGDYWRPSSLISRKACFSSPMQTCSCDEKDSWCSYVSRSWTWSWQVIPFMLISDNHFLRHSWWKLQPPLYQFLTSVTSSEQVPFHIFEIHSISHTNYWVWLHNGLWPGQYKLMTD